MSAFEDSEEDFEESEEKNEADIAPTVACFVGADGNPPDFAKIRPRIISYIFHKRDDCHRPLRCGMFCRDDRPRSSAVTPSLMYNIVRISRGTIAIVPYGVWDVL